MLINFLFRDSVTLDKPKFIEETAKFVASFVASIASLFISNINENLKNTRKIKALNNMLKEKFSVIKVYIDSVIDDTSKASINGVSKNSITETKIYVHMKEDLKNPLKHISSIISESKDLINKEGVEIGVAFSNFMEILDKAAISIDKFNGNPSQKSSSELKLCLENLTHFFPEVLDNKK